MNRYPTNLNQLVPRYLKKISADAFGAGEALRYKLTRKEYSLYSIGPDGIDNHGCAVKDDSRNGQRRFTILPESKGDMVAGIN